MGSTPNYSWQYPALTDPPNVPQHLQNLADAADATVKGLDTRLDRIAMPPYVSLTNLVGQTVATSTPVPINWDHEYADTVNGHSTSDNVVNTRYTSQQTGRYLAVATLSGTLTAAGSVQFFFKTNGTLNSWGSAINAGAGTFAFNIIRMPWLQAGDFIQIYAFQSTGQPMNLAQNTGLNGGCLWEMTWLGDT